MTAPLIQTPRGFITTDRSGKASLEWNTNFRPKWQRRFSAAQSFMDSEILRLSEQFTPLRTGILIKSGILGTEIGSGVVKWIAPYARRQYYMARKVGTETGPLRGPFWFERMKAIYKSQLIAGARRLAGNG